MKKIELKLTLEVTDSDNFEDWVSDLQDACFCDSCKSVQIEGEGKSYNFENEDFEEE